MKQVKNIRLEHELLLEIGYSRSNLGQFVYTVSGLVPWFLTKQLLYFGLWSWIRPVMLRSTLAISVYTVSGLVLWFSTKSLLLFDLWPLPRSTYNAAVNLGHFVYTMCTVWPVPLILNKTTYLYLLTFDLELGLECWGQSMAILSTQCVQLGLSPLTLNQKSLLLFDLWPLTFA
jgi:hypothetical protein